MMKELTGCDDDLVVVGSIFQIVRYAAVGS